MTTPDVLPVAGSGLTALITVGTIVLVGIIVVGVGMTTVGVAVGMIVGVTTTVVGASVGDGVVVGARVGVAVGCTGDTDGCVDWLPSAYTTNDCVIVFNTPLTSFVVIEIVWVPGLRDCLGRYFQLPVESVLTESLITSVE